MRVDSDELVDNILCGFCETIVITNALLTMDGHMMLVSDKMISLHSRMKTLGDHPQLTSMLMRISDVSPLPDAFLEKYFSDGYDPERVQLKFGMLFENAAIKKTVSVALNYERTLPRIRSCASSPPKTSSAQAWYRSPAHQQLRTQSSSWKSSKPKTNPTPTSRENPIIFL